MLKKMFSRRLLVLLLILTVGGAAGCKGKVTEKRKIAARSREKIRFYRKAYDDGGAAAL